MQKELLDLYRTIETLEMQAEKVDYIAESITEKTENTDYSVVSGILLDYTSELLKAVAEVKQLSANLCEKVGA